MLGNKGQSLLEFALCSLILFAIAGGAAGIFRAEWQRTHCMRLAFEAAHRARIGMPARHWSEWVSVEPIENGYRGIAQCGNHRETAELPTLEGGHWE